MSDLAIDLHWLRAEPVLATGTYSAEHKVVYNVVMKGHFRNPKATKEAFAGGWFHSGDLGVMQADGYIQLKDRSQDVIISGGENIPSIKVEEALYRLPAVAVVAVVAMPHDRWGETLGAFIKLVAGQQADAATIKNWCREELAA
jgi:fatty-acyl-CoA synthase